MPTTFEVGQQLVALCNQNKHLDAIKTLYHPDVVSVEVHGTPEMPARMQGLPKVLAKSEWWLANHTIHAGHAKGPYPHADRFIVFFTMDVTAKTGPMAGKRMTFDEAALYTVHDGKITHEEFFYHMG